MIWLASFPRSGNTFFRNVLFEVYGIESSTFHKETSYPVDENYDQYKVVKTHLLPSQLDQNDSNIKSVYLVRDGRDALVSIAHHRKDLVAPYSDFQINLLEAIIAANGSHFGGWSQNVKQWIEKADIVIRFEDLIKNPIKEVEKLRKIMDLPEPKLDKLPTFESLKYGSPKYGSGKNYSINESEQRYIAKKSFRKGMIGGWKEEMNIDVEMLFWQIHGDMMTNLGYSRQKNSKKINVPLIPYKILIEANKLMMENNDGIKRYQTELLSNFILLQDIFPKKWEIDLYLPGGNIINLNGLQKIIKRIKVLPSFVYNTLSWIYRKLPFKYALSSFRKMFSSNVNRLNNEKFKKYDLIHIPLPQNFHYLKNANNKFLVTIHDLTHKFFPEFHKSENIKLAEDGIKSLITKDAHLIAISKSTKQDLIKYYPEIKPDDVSVIYEACNRSQFEPKKEEYLKQKVLKKYELPECPYFLCVSTLEPRKNILNTIKAFKKLTKENKNQELALFICGNNGWKMDELLKEQKLTQQNIYFTGFLNEEDLPVLYSNALALCYISIYEGFGLPPLEAMACGTTVIYGNNSSMPEIIGEAGVAADPSNIDDIKSKMNLLLNNQYREDLNYKALQRAHQFSWLKTAWETLNLYEELIEKNKPIT